MAAVEWTAAEREAVGRAVHEHDANASMSGVEWPTWDDLGDEGRAAYGDLAEDILDALARFVAERERQAAARAVREFAAQRPLGGFRREVEAYADRIEREAQP